MSQDFVTNFDPETLTNSYIVLLKDTPVSTDTHIDWIRKEESDVVAAAGDSVPETTFQVNGVFHAFRAYSATMTDTALETLKGCGDVEHIIKDTLVTTCADPPAQTLNIQDNAPWGLQRASWQDPLPAGSSPAELNYQYRWASGLKPIDVDAYVVDTGVFLGHEEFEGRARWGKTFGGYRDADGNGHGTHVAATIAGKRFGLAKNANIIAVKVLGDNGQGRTSDIMHGLQWVVQQVGISQRPSVINMSLGGTGNIGLDRAATSAVRAGIHVCVAAGNESQDASNTSPARADGVITVGATTIKDQFADFSNFGNRLNILAPGEDIISASIKSPTAYISHSGTSMATPHVAGVIAWLIYLQGNRSPEEALEELKKRGIKDVVAGVPADTVNLLLNNGV